MTLRANVSIEGTVAEVEAAQNASGKIAAGWLLATRGECHEHEEEVGGE